MQRKNIFQIPTTDFSFKRIFATEKNKRFLIAFLNCAVSNYTGEIVDITYLPTEKYGIEATEKRVVFDIACRDIQDREFIIEMQRTQQPEFIERTLVYLSRAISSSMAKGELRYRILPTYSVNLLDFELAEYRDTNECFRAIFLKDPKNNVLTKKLGIFYLNLCNFAAEQDEVSKDLRQWLYLLKNMQNLEETDYIEQEGIFKDLLDECRISKMSQMERQDYEKSVLEYQDVQEAIAYAKELAAKSAFEEGMEKGVKKGVKKGVEKERLSIARKMIENGFDISAVVKITGLTDVEARNILKEKDN